MQLLQSWKESLLIFKLSHFKLFFLVTVKSIWETYKLLFRYFWWLILLMLLLHAWTLWLFTIAFLFTHGTPRIGLFVPFLFLSLSFFSEVVFFYVIILIARSSVEQKRRAYFCKYLFSWYFLSFIPLFFLIIFLFLVVLVSQNEGILSSVWSLISSWFLFLNLFVFVIFFALFFLDTSPASLRTTAVSICRTIKIITYNYPFFFAMFFALYILSWLLHFCVPPGLFQLFYPVSLFLLMPVLVCTLTNFYIKQVHEHFDLYFGKGPSE